jgi:hypothetical protein
MLLEPGSMAYYRNIADHPAESLLGARTPPVEILPGVAESKLAPEPEPALASVPEQSVSGWSTSEPAMPVVPSPPPDVTKAFAYGSAPGGTYVEPQYTHRPV